MDVQNTYVYKVSTSAGIYLGDLQNITSEPNVYNEINSAGASLEITVGLSGDTSFENVLALETEGGASQIIETESLETITTERTPDVVGNFNNNALIRNNNLIVVIEYSRLYPNGVTIFNGYMSKWVATFGDDDDINISCLGYGTELDNYIIEAIPTTDVSQTSQNTGFVLGGYGAGAPVGQSFVSGTNLLDSVDLWLSASSPKTVNISIYNNSSEAASDIFGTGSRLATVDVLVSNVVAAEVKFTLPTTLSIVNGNSYFIAAKEVTNSNTVTIFYQNTNVYANGGMFVGGGVSPFSYFQTPIGVILTASDLYFKTNFSSGAVSSPFLSTDPSVMVKTILDAYIAASGRLTYTGASIPNTGITASYTFSVNTALEGIRKALSLAPANWYWFVDPGTNLLSFKPTGTTADHTFVKSANVGMLSIQATVERLKNIVYFTGGPTAGVNLFLKATNTTSLQTNRRGVERITDNRVTLPNTGALIQSAFLAENSIEKYITNVTILTGTYDTTTIAIGQLVRFADYGVSFVENLLLQIVSIRRSPDKVVIGLGILPKRQTIDIETLQRSLLETQTVANPGTPS